MKNNILLILIFLTLISCSKTEQKKTSIISGSFGKLLTEDIILKALMRIVKLYKQKIILQLKSQTQKAFYFELNKGVEIFLLLGDSIFIQSLDDDYNVLGGESAIISNQLKFINQEKLNITTESKKIVIAANGNIDDRLYLEIIASLASIYEWETRHFFI